MDTDSTEENQSQLQPPSPPLLANRDVSQSEQIDASTAQPAPHVSESNQPSTELQETGKATAGTQVTPPTHHYWLRSRKA